MYSEGVDSIYRNISNTVSDSKNPVIRMRYVREAIVQPDGDNAAGHGASAQSGAGPLGCGLVMMRYWSSQGVQERGSFHIL
jgi:hypothetical protein